MVPQALVLALGVHSVGIIVALLTNNIHLSSLSGILLSILAVLLWPFILGAALCRLLGFHIPGIDIT